MYHSSLHIHFIGIGGVGMAGIAEVLLSRGYAISGSDIKDGALTKHLKKLGAQVFIGHRAEHLPDHVGVVVVSSAIDPENPELLAARSRGVPIIPRAEMLAELMRTKFGIAVAGSHGKTTTTSLVAHILEDSKLDPTVIIGGRVLTQSSGASAGMGEFLVAEADESDGSFRLLRPAIAIVTNIDREHLNHYGSFGALENEFFDFMKSVPFYGLVVACIDDPVVKRLTERLERRVVTYGRNPDAQLFVENIQAFNDRTQFTLHYAGKSYAAQIPMLGTHSVLNATAALAVGLEVGISIERGLSSLAKFPGVARRCEVIAEERGVLILDDYGHHPTEIVSTLSGIRRAYFESGARKGRMIVIFQPHRFTRTRELFSEFLAAFTDADVLYVTDIYAAGEAEEPEMHAKKLVEHLQHPAVSYLSDVETQLVEILDSLRPGDVLLTLGAGNVTQYSRQAAELLRNENERKFA